MTEDRTRKILTAAHGRLVEKPTRWTSGALARNRAGEKVKPSSPYAVKFDARGLLLSYVGTDSLDHRDVFPCTQLVLLAAVERGYRSSSACNDLEGRRGAIGMLARAIELIDTEPNFAALLERAASIDLKPLALAGEKGTT